MFTDSLANLYSALPSLTKWILNKESELLKQKEIQHNITIVPDTPDSFSFISYSWFGSTTLASI